MIVEPYPIDITPSVGDVAALLRARTKDVNGVEVGTLNTTRGRPRARRSR